MIGTRVGLNACFEARVPAGSCRCVNQAETPLTAEERTILAGLGLQCRNVQNQNPLDSPNSQIVQTGRS